MGWSFKQGVPTFNPHSDSFGRKHIFWQKFGCIFDQLPIFVHSKNPFDTLGWLFVHSLFVGSVAKKTLSCNKINSPIALKHKRHHKKVAPSWWRTGIFTTATLACPWFFWFCVKNPRKPILLKLGLGWENGQAIESTNGSSNPWNSNKPLSGLAPRCCRRLRWQLCLIFLLVSYCWWTKSGVHQLMW